MPPKSEGQENPAAATPSTTNAGIGDVDVVIPLYNKAPFVAQAIHSALKQSRLPRAIYVIDDGSTDGSLAVASAIARENELVSVLSTPHPGPRGAAAARNVGLSHCVSEFVAFLDADDFWEPTKLERQVAALRDPDVGIVHCGIRTVAQDGSVLSSPPTRLPLEASLSTEVRLGRYHIAGSASTIVARRNLIQQAGNFREDLEFAEDWDMWARLAGLGGLAVIPDHLANIRIFGTRWQSASDAERFARWVGVLDRWKDDPEFMRLAEAEVRGISARHQLAMILRPRKMLSDYPSQVKSLGGYLGARMYGTRGAYFRSVITLPYFLARRALGKVVRRYAARKALTVTRPDGALDKVNR